MRQLKIKSAILPLLEQLCQSSALTAKPNDKGYLTNYADGIYPDARKDISVGGKFYNMFNAGDGQEFTPTEKRPAKASAVHSSSMLAYNFFHWVSPEYPLTYKGVTYDKVYFEVKMKVLDKNQKGYTINRPANMDVVLISTDNKTMLCLESKFTEHLKNAAPLFVEPYRYEQSYYNNNPYKSQFIRFVAHYDRYGKGYYEGIKQNICHLIALTNLKHDASALEWFKNNNPYIEKEVLTQINSDTNILFTNMLYYPQNEQLVMQNNTKFTDLLMEFETELPEQIKSDFLSEGLFHLYSEFLLSVKDQMPQGLSDYLSKRYLLTTI